MFIADSGRKGPHVYMRPTGPAIVGADSIESARLVFDSRDAAVPSGVRSIPGGRKLVYASRHYLIDLRIDWTVEPGRMIVVGQLTTSKEKKGVEGATVMVFSDKATLGKAQTNRHGEFRLEFPPCDEELSVTVGFEQGGSVVILDGLGKVQA
jgi:hypothetical protein